MEGGATAGNPIITPSVGTPRASPLESLSIRGLPRRRAFGRVVFFAMVAAFLAIDVLAVLLAASLVDKPFPGFLLNDRMVISYKGPLHWSGVQAGLTYPDKVLTANDMATTTVAQLAAVVRAARVGTPIRYTIEKGADVLEVTVPTMTFTWRDLALSFGVTFLLANSYFLLGLIVFVLKPDASASWAFLIACFLQSIGDLSSFDIQSTHFGLIRIYLMATAYLAAAVLHLSMVFPDKWSWLARYPWTIAAPYLLSTALAAVMVGTYPQPLFLVMYSAVLVYLAVSVVALIGSIAWAFWRSASYLARTRAKVVLAGSVLAFPIPAIAPLVSFFGGSIGGLPFQLTAIPQVIFPATVAYAIAKHNLFDVDIYIKRAVGYGIMTIGVGALYLMLQLVIRKSVLEPIFGSEAENVFPILFAVLIVFFFNPVSRKVQESVDKLFFRKRYDFKATVAAVSSALVSVLDLNAILQQIIRTIRHEMSVDTAGLILLDDRKRECVTVFRSADAAGRDSSDSGAEIAYDAPLLKVLARDRKLITKYDILEDPRYEDVRDGCSRWFAARGVSIAIPLMHQDQLRGVLAVGYKQSGSFYSRDDIDLLQTLANEGTVAIENAKLVERMKKEEAARVNLARYLSPQIVERVIHHDVKVDLGGMRKVVTVMFSDIRNFTSISEARAPDEVVAVLNEYLTAMSLTIFDRQGSIDKFIGDAIMAVFGSLIPLERSSSHAIWAAYDMRRKLPLLNERWSKQYGFMIQMGIGIDTGEVFLGNVGSPERMEFTVIGDTVNRASRLESLTKFYGVGIIAGGSSCEGDDGFLFRPLDIVSVKGKQDAIEIFEPLCPREEASPALFDELAAYGEALTAYRAMQWETARRLFAGLHERSPLSKLYTIYLDRIDKLSTMGVDREWRGVHVHETK